MAVFSLEDCATSRAPGRLLRRLDKIMATYVESKFDGLDLSFQQWVALKVVRDGVVGNAGELSRELGITTGATTRMIDVLEARGLMERDRCTEDRRVVRLVTTPAGKDVVLKLQVNVVAVWNEVLADFTQDEAGMLVDLLIKLLAAAERVAGGVTEDKEIEE
jgi:DNA-binding MarR family transcriptional regulator